MKQEIRNTVGKLVGYIITEGSGNAAAFDARNLKLGTYEASESWRSHGNDDDVWQSLLREWLVQHYRKGAARNIPC